MGPVKQRCSVVAAILLPWGTPAPATDYFVATNGSDSASGLTPTNAFATIQHAANLTLPGDAVRVLPGSYAGFRMEHSGRPGTPIRLMAEPPWAARLNSPGPANRRNGVVEVETYSGSGVVSNVLVEGFVVSGSPRYGIDARSCLDVTLRGNLVSNSVSTGIFAPFAYRILIESNTCAYNGEHGIYVNNSSDGFTIRGNRLHHNRYSGVHLNGDYSIPPPDGTPWIHDGTMSKGLVEGNVIYQNGTGGAGINMDGVDTTVVRNNLIYESPNNSGIALYVQDGRAPSRQNLIAHNSIVMSGNGGWAINIANAGCVSNRILNNCAYSLQSFRGAIVLAAPQIQGLVCDYNALESRFSVDNGGSAINFATWQSYGHDANSFSALPADLYVDTASRNYHLRASSPAIDRGTSGVQAPYDGEGVPRPLDGNADGTAQYDMGAYEFVHPTADTDHDRSSDVAELTAGTDPRDPVSLFRLTIGNSSGPGGMPAISWPSAAGREYAVRGSVGMREPLVEYTNSVPATPPTNVWSETGAPSSGVYRVTVRVRG